MTLSPSQILGRLTETAVADVILACAAEIGFRTTSWRDGSVQKTLIRGVARTMAGASNVLGTTLDNLIIRPAGAWQDLRGVYWYQLPRLEAVRAVRNMLYTSAASAPAHVITVGSQVSSNGQAFEVVQILDVDGVLVPGGTRLVSMRAIVAGTAGNLASTDAVALVTPYAGVTAAWLGDVTTIGTDRETDARYQLRLDLRWAELTYSIGLRAYELWALTADGSIDRVTAWTNHPNPNEVYIAIDPGTAPQIAAADAYALARCAVNDIPSHHAANPVAQNIAAAPRIKVGTTTVAEIEAVWTAYLDGMRLGGVRIAGAPAGRLLPEALTKAVLCGLPGVESVNLSEPAAPVVMAPDDYIVPTYSITPEWVP